MRTAHLVSALSTVLAAAMIVGCAGDTGPTGPSGEQGQPGAPGKQGDPGKSGAPGSTGKNGDPAPNDQPLELPGPAFYPTGISATADGTLFVASAGTGEVVAFAPGAEVPKVIVPGPNPPVIAANLVVDEATKTLWVCDDGFGGPNFTEPAATLNAYDFDGHLRHAYPLPQQGSSLCEDVAVDANHNVFVSDAFLGAIYVLSDPNGSLRTWATDTRLLPTDEMVPPFGAHGLVVAGTNLYVDNFNTSVLLRFPIHHDDGSAGEAAVVTVTPALTNPEVLRVVDETHLLITQDIWASPNGQLAELTLGDDDTATATTLMNDIEGPTSVAVSNGSYWVTESQISKLLAGTTPDLPFRVLHAYQQ